MAFNPDLPNSNDPQDSPVIGNVTDLNAGTGQDGFSRSGPLLSPKEFKKRYLFGVPMKAALTGDELEIEDLKDFIDIAVSELETVVRISVSPGIKTDKIDFDRADDLQFSTRRTEKWPVQQILKLEAVWPGRLDNGTEETQAVAYPTTWVSIREDTGIFSILPNSSSLSQADAQFLYSLPFRSLTLGNMNQWPNLWRLTYKHGFVQDRVPHIVNHCLGIMAAIAFLSQMGPAIFPMNSVSVGIDGLSQGSGSPGPQWLAGRVQDLMQERDRLVMQLKQHFGTDVFMGVW